MICFRGQEPRDTGRFVQVVFCATFVQTPWAAFAGGVPDGLYVLRDGYPSSGWSASAEPKKKRSDPGQACQC